MSFTAIAPSYRSSRKTIVCSCGKGVSKNNAPAIAERQVKTGIDENGAEIFETAKYQIYTCECGNEFGIKVQLV